MIIQEIHDTRPIETVEYEIHNLRLDRELTKDMHLVYPFHNLFEHMEFSIFDLLRVRDFNIEVEVDMDFPCHYDNTKRSMNNYYLNRIFYFCNERIRRQYHDKRRTSY